MSLPSQNALTYSRRALSVLVAVNLVYGAGIIVLLVASLVAEGPVMAALGVRPAPDSATMILGMRMIMVVGIGSVPLAHVMLTRLLAIVDTVRAGDPFIIENGRRLHTIAWALLAMQVLHVIVGIVAAGSRSQAQQLDIDWSFSLAPWIAVLLLFVLARVFEHGARMRADLEGTV